MSYKETVRKSDDASLRRELAMLIEHRDFMDEAPYTLLERIANVKQEMIKRKLKK